MSRRKIVVGVAGKCCAGKDTVSRFFIDRGFRDINVDRIGHLALEYEKDAVVSRFGNDVIGENGSVDRSRLGHIVFGDRRALADLESIIHPWMAEQVRLAVEDLRKAGNGPGGDAPGGETGAVINAALLFSMGLDRFCDYVIWTDASFFQRFRRARRRDRLSLKQVLRRLRSQKRLKPQEKESGADMITVENSGSRTVLFERLGAMLKEFHAGD